MNDAVLVQCASGAFTQMLDLTAARHAAWATRHDADYVAVRGHYGCDREASWAKVPLLLDLLPRYRRLWWLDADALIVGDEEPWAHCPAGRVALARHPNPAHWNCGVIVMDAGDEAQRAALTGFWRTVWERGPVRDPWWEQRVVNDLLAGTPDLVVELPARFNSTERVTEVPDPVVRAWHGLPFAQRLAAMVAALQGATP